MGMRLQSKHEDGWEKREPCYVARYCDNGNQKTESGEIEFLDLWDIWSQAQKEIPTEGYVDYQLLKKDRAEWEERVAKAQNPKSCPDKHELTELTRFEIPEGKRFK